MRIHRLVAVGVWLVASGTVLVSPGVSRVWAQPGWPGTADALDIWNDQTARSVVTVAGQGPPVSAIHLGIVHASIYNAVIAVKGGYRPFATVLAHAPTASVEAAVATAAHDTLVGLFPAQRADLDARLTSTLAALPDGPAKDAGISVGRQAAAAILRLRAEDGRFANVPFTAGGGPGKWEPAPPAFGAYAFPWIGQVKPLALQSPDQFRPAGPPALTSRKYADDFNEVKALGARNSTVRTAKQTEVGLFWNDHATMQWNRAIALDARRRRLSLTDRARLYAQVWVSVADSVIGCWNAKSHYNFWRPIMAIRRAETDGNPLTEPDPTWEPLVPTAPHPDYPSGHNCFTSAVIEVMESFYQTPDVVFAMDSAFTNTVHGFPRIVGALAEVIEARIYIGYHFRSADVDGAALGRKTARYVLDHHFQPSR